MLLEQLLTHKEGWIRKFAAFLVNKNYQYQFTDFIEEPPLRGTDKIHFKDIRAYFEKGTYVVRKVPYYSRLKLPVPEFELYLSWPSSLKESRHYQLETVEEIAELLSKREWDPPLDF